MASVEHTEMVRRGVDVWNEWRQGHAEIQPDLRAAMLSGLNLEGIDLRHAKLNGVNLVRSHLQQAQLADAELAEADLSDADLTQANLARSDLSRAILRGSRLAGAHLAEATLRDATLNFCDLREAYLAGADLSGTAMRDVILAGANLTSADLATARISGACFGSTVMRKVQGLASVVHDGPSWLDPQTVLLSDLPAGFLRGCGWPDDLIGELAGDRARRLEFFSCFISYASEDAEFAERLHADLQNAGVRCWFAPHDMRIGERIRDTLDTQVRLHDKVLLILSHESIASEWVEDEVEAAFERERKEQDPVLFPLRLDDSALSTGEAWAAKLRRQRHMGDFVAWREREQYEQALAKLLRALRRRGDLETRHA